MRCKFCGAEIKEGNNACEYCGSAVERHTFAARNYTSAFQSNKNPVKSIVGMICKGIIILACVWGVVVVISLIVVLNSDVFKDNYEHYASTDTTYQMPRNEKNLTGQIISCDKKGVAAIEYGGHTYEDVAILDKSLIKWINDTDKEEHYYGGYFSYPDLRLYSAEEKVPLSMSYMDPECEDKESEVSKEYYTGEEITIYKIFANGTWYCCSKKTYDSIEIGDLLNEYELYSNQEPAFIVRNATVSD